MRQCQPLKRTAGNSDSGRSGSQRTIFARRFGGIADALETDREPLGRRFRAHDTAQLLDQALQTRRCRGAYTNAAFGANAYSG
jgi:hypothetical protein